MNNDSIMNLQQDGRDKITKLVKGYVFDLIGAGLIIAVGLVSLGAIELKDITFKQILNIIAEMIPFYFASVALALNFYKKGVFAGRSTEGFINAMTFYSDKVNKLTAQELNYLEDFCDEYNYKALRNIQETILRSVAIPYDIFDAPYKKDGVEYLPLKTLSYAELEKMYNKKTAKAIIKASNSHIKGINMNMLLSNLDTYDPTDIGLNEQQLFKKRSKQYAAAYSVGIFFMTLLAVKDITQWGWVGATLIVFKLLYILCRSYMKYFEGYEDITIKVNNHLSRKSDILKQYEYWYNNKTN